MALGSITFDLLYISFFKSFACTSVIRTCFHEGVFSVFNVLPQPVDACVSEIVFIYLNPGLVSVPFHFGDDGLWSRGDPCLCFQIEHDVVLSVVAKLIEATDVSSLIIPFTAVKILDYMGSWERDKASVYIWRCVCSLCSWRGWTGLGTGRRYIRESGSRVTCYADVCQYNLRPFVNSFYHLLLKKEFTT